MEIYHHFWRVKKTLPERFRQPCRILACARGSGPRNILVQFPDGHRVIAPRFSVRIAKEP